MVVTVLPVQTPTTTISTTDNGEGASVISIIDTIPPVISDVFENYVAITNDTRHVTLSPVMLATLKPLRIRK